MTEPQTAETESASTERMAAHDAVETGYHKAGPPPDPVPDGATKADPSPYDDPEFQKEFKESLARQIEGWHKDWGLRINSLMAALSLTRSEAMLYLLLMQVGGLRGLASGFQEMWNDDPAQRRRAMQDALLESQLKERGFNLGEEEDRGVPISEAAKAAINATPKTPAKGWKIR